MKKPAFESDAGRVVVANPIEISSIRFTPKDFKATADQIKLLIHKI